MQAAPNRTAGEFLSQYLEMSGFNAENGPFMVCKELLDNAVDACARCTGPRFPSMEPGRVELQVTLNEKFKQVSCRDTGTGIDCNSVSALGNVFCSSKAQDSETAGEFGIGLKAIMLFSQKQIAEPIHITIRMSEHEVWSFDLTLDATLAAQTINDFEVVTVPLSSWPWMTEISVKLLPCWEARQESDIEAYAAAHAIWSKHASSALEMKVFHASQFKTTVATASALHDEARIEMTAAVVAVETAELFANSADLWLLRSSNGMPLMPSDGPACLLTKCLGAFLTQRGPQFGIEMLTSDQPNAPLEAQNRSSWDCITKMSCRLCVRNAEDSEWNTILLAVNVTSKKALFGTLSKSFLQGAPKLRSTIVAGFHRLFNHLKTALPSGFQSLEDSERRKATEVYAPNMATSLASIICTSPNPHFQAAALELLDLQHMKLQSNSESSELSALSSLSSKRARTKANNEIIQDRLLDLILKKLGDSECRLPPAKKRGKKLKLSQTSSPSSSESS